MEDVLKTKEEIIRDLTSENEKSYINLKNEYGEKYAATLLLAFWTHVLSVEATMPEYFPDERENFYKLKNKAIKILVENSKLIDFSFYKSSRKRIKGVDFCKEHRDIYYNNWEISMKYNKVEYFIKRVQCCDDCELHYDENYYSLVNIIVGDSDNKVILNLPYPLIDTVLSNEQSILVKFSNNGYNKETYDFKNNSFECYDIDDKNDLVGLDSIKYFNKSLENFKKVYEIE